LCVGGCRAGRGKRAPLTRVSSKGGGSRVVVSVERKRAPPARISSEGGGSGEVDVENGDKKTLRLAFRARKGGDEWWWVVMDPE
jgi:hypothetical protein